MTEDRFLNKVSTNSDSLKDFVNEFKPVEVESPQSFIAYTEYSKTLRTWLVTYGIGGPILFISQDQIATKLAASPNKSCIIYLFLIGVAAQVAISLLNKWLNWIAYEMDMNPPLKLRTFHNAVIWLANQFWFDILCDIVSVASFIVATFLVLRIMLT
jgi:hypothetical protein